MRRAAALAVALVATSWGVIGVLVRWTRLPAPVIVWGRTGIGALVLAPLVVLRRRRRGRGRGGPELKRRGLGRLGFALGPLLAAHWLALVGAQQRAPIGTVLLITYLSPVIVAGLAGPILHEHLGFVVVASLVIALTGTWILARPTRHAGSGELLAVVAAMTYAGLVLTAKRLAERVDPVTYSFVQLSGAAVVLSPWALSARWGRASTSWWWLVALGVVFTGVLLPVFVGLLQRLPATTVGVLSYLEPASAVVCGWVLLDERPGAGTAVGGMLIVVAGICVVLAPASRQGATLGVSR